MDARISTLGSAGIRRIRAGRGDRNDMVAGLPALRRVAVRLERYLQRRARECMGRVLDGKTLLATASPAVGIDSNVRRPRVEVGRQATRVATLPDRGILYRIGSGCELFFEYELVQRSLPIGIRSTLGERA